MYRLLQVLWFNMMISLVMCHIVRGHIIRGYHPRSYRPRLSSEVISSEVILANGWLMGPCEHLSHLTPTVSMTETVCLVQTSTSAMGSICYLWSGVISSEVISSNVILSKVILSKVILANGWLMGPCEDLSHEVLL